MNLERTALTELRSRLRVLDGLRANREAVIAQVAPATDAEARLRAQMDDLDSEAAAVANVRIPSGPSRVAQLIAGAEVAQPDKSDIEARALKAHHIAAQRQQVEEDLTAVQAHISSLNADAARIDRQISADEDTFLELLEDAVFAAFKRDAVAFIAQHVPQMSSLARMLRMRHGEGSVLEHAVSGLKVSWYEKEWAIENQIRKGVTIWPRSDANLLSGEVVRSDEVVESLIADIRNSQPGQ